MALTEPTPRVAVEVMAYQAQTLLDRVETYRREDYPQEALEISFLLGSFAEYIRDELAQLALLAAPTPRDLGRARSLLRIAQELYALIRFIQASDSKYTPPSIQVALTGIAERVFPKEAERLVALVRPQWAYNLKYVPLTWVLRTKVQLETLDPHNKLGLITPNVVPTPQEKVEIADRFLQIIWTNRRNRLKPPDQETVSKKPPKQIAVLSFAGLDKDVTYQFPILAHELGHFIDFSSYPPHHVDPEIVKASWVDPREVEAAIAKHQGTVTAAEVDAYWQQLTDRLAVCIREILADMLGARMIGLGFFLAQAEFLTRIFGWDQPKVTRSGYPGLAYRLSIILDEIHQIGEPGNLNAFYGKHEVGEQETARIAMWVGELLRNWQLRIEEELKQGRTSAGDSPALQALDELAAAVIDRAVPAIRSVAARLLPDEKAAVLTDSFFDRVFSLIDNLPPSLSGDSPDQVAEIMSSAWVFQLMFGQPAERAREGDQRHAEFKKSCRLVLKAIELAAASDELLEKPVDVPGVIPKEINKSVLEKGEIQRRLGLDRGEAGRIVLVPRSGKMIQSASVDVRLGHWFKIARRPRLPYIDVTSELAQKVATEVAHEEIFVPFRERLIIHPGDFVLGATLEFLALPTDVMAFVEGRSRLGRTGLIVATATQVAPGFHGCVVLELANAGAIPIQVRPGMAVAQMVFITLTNPGPPYDGSSQCQIKP